MKKLLQVAGWIIAAPFRLLFWIISLPFRLAGRLLAWLFQPVVERMKGGKIYRFFTDTPEDRPALDALNNAVDNPQQILDQLDEVRKHLIRALGWLALGVLISFSFAEPFLAYLAAPVGGLGKLQAISVTEEIGVFMRVALLAGIAFASPFIALEVWLFAAPGLMPKARLKGLLAIPAALALFVGGAAFTYYVMLPVALPFLLNFLGIEARPTASNYFTFSTGLMFWIGVAFEFPLVIYALSSMGIVKPKMLLDHWRIAVIAIAILSAAITPTVDPVNMALVMLPMSLLYLLSVLASWIANRKKTDDKQSAGNEVVLQK